MKIKTLNQLVKNEEAETKANQLVLGIVLSFDLDAPVEDTTLEILPDTYICTNLLRDMISVKEEAVEEAREAEGGIHAMDMSEALRPEMELMGSLAVL